MKIILRDDIASLGEAGEIVEVKDGYGRNYLIPRGMAYAATKGNIKVWEDEKKKRLKRIAQETAVAEKVKAALESVNVTIRMQVGEEGRLFGSVTNRMIASYFGEKGYEVDHRDIIIDEPIRSQGTFDVTVDLGHAVSADIKVTVVPENEPEPIAAAATESPETATDEKVETEAE
jgi:large subunit ribosomal protein L9